MYCHVALRGWAQGCSTLSERCGRLLGFVLLLTLVCAQQSACHRDAHA